jgi:hypothetical protein
MLIKLEPLDQRDPDLVDRVAFRDRPRALLDEGHSPRVRSDQILESS